jgi:mannose-6-phosphate isomerase-like protein (cupin superfamily)
MKLDKDSWNLIDLGTERIYEILKTESFSLAYAEIHESKLHKHRRATEIYIVVEGNGTLFLGDEQIEISKGDVVKIPPNTPHKVTSDGWVKIFVLSYPPWSEDDHEVLE